VEAVAARSPDLVVLYQGPTTAAPAAQLRALGIAVLAYRTDRLADVSRVARRLGAALGAGRAADSLASAYDSALARLRHTTRLPRSPTVALVTWDQPLIVLGAGSFVSEMVEKDIAGVVAFLASDEARWISGDTVRVDGGSKL
jgi:ABC-type Fe3+-hydroxamate transport system substrate-binding protein